MLIIGHRGAAGLAPENTLEALRAGAAAGADILEFDVRLTADNIPILSHDAHLHGRTVGRTTLADLQKAGIVTLLADVLDEFFAVVMLNLEYKPNTGADIVYRMIKKHIKTSDDWDAILISSFHLRPLFQLRRLDERLNLALLHSINPFAFVAYQRSLQLSAVGWHRLHVNPLATSIAKKAKIFTYVYTVNRPKAALLLAQKDIDGVVTDYPDRLAT